MECKLHYHVQNRTPLIPVLSQTNPPSHPISLRYILILSSYKYEITNFYQGIFQTAATVNGPEKNKQKTYIQHFTID
jgi:hypothetical protein